MQTSPAFLTQISIAGNALTMTGAAALNQNLLTTSTPQFARIGIGVAADSTIPIYSEASVSEQVIANFTNDHTNGYGMYVQSVGTGGRYIARFAAGATAVFTVDSAKTTNTGNMVFSPDNSYDIGASGATRPRTIYAATGFTGTFLSQEERYTTCLVLGMS